MAKENGVRLNPLLVLHFRVLRELHRNSICIERRGLDAELTTSSSSQFNARGNKKATSRKNNNKQLVTVIAASLP